MTKNILTAKPAPLWRVACAIVYDSFLIIGCLLVVMFIIVAINGFKSIAGVAWKEHLTTIVLLIVWAAFFIYFWSQQGQTLGMRAWKLVLITKEGVPPKPLRALYRWLIIAIVFFLPVSFCFAANLIEPKKDWLLALIILTFPVILGYSFMLFDKSKRSLFDHLSGSHIVVVNQNPYQKQ